MLQISAASKCPKAEFQKSKILFSEGTLISIWTRNHVPACEEDIQGLEQPCSAQPRDITAEMGMTLHIPAGSFSYNKSHVRRQPVPLCSFTLSLVWICSTWASSVLTLWEHLVSSCVPRAPPRPGRAACSWWSWVEPENWGENFDNWELR